MALDALIFDVDGTLAETERDGHRPAFNEAFAAAGLTWQWDVDRYRALLAVTGGKERIRAYASAEDPAFLARPDAAERIAALHADKTRRYVRRVAAGEIPLRPGVARLVAEARTAGLRLAIATTTAPDNVVALLTHTLGPGADSWFAVIGAGDVVPAKKPAPDVYRWVTDRLGVDPARCLAIEDSAVGLAAALGAGLPTVVTPSDYTAGEEATGALAVLPDLTATDLADLTARHAAWTSRSDHPAAAPADPSAGRPRP